MTHGEALELLDAWLDNELDPAATSSMERHVEDCASCAARVDERQRLGALLQLPGVTHSVPPTAELALARVARPPRAFDVLQVTWPRAVAAAMLFGLGGFWFGAQFEGSRAVGDELIAAHVRASLSPSATDVESTDHHTVKPWFSQRLPFSPPVPEFNNGADVLLGGRVDVVQSERVAVLVYRHGKHNVEVFVTPVAHSMRMPGAMALNGFNVLGGSWGGFSIAWVSDVSRDELEGFRERWLQRASLQSTGSRP